MTAIVFDKELEERLERLAEQTHQPVSTLVSEMVRGCLEINEWHCRAIEKSVTRADSGEAKFVDHDDVDGWLKSWGTDHEREPPQCA